MSGLYPFASEPHAIWSPLAEDIHKAVDLVGLSNVQGFVRQWASNYTRDDEAARDRSKAQHAAIELLAESHGFPDERRIGSIPPSIASPKPPLPPDHRAYSVAEKWAVLAAIHDVYRKGEKINPFPDTDNASDWKGWVENGGFDYLEIMYCAGRLVDADGPVVAEWLRDVIAGSAPSDDQPPRDGSTDNPAAKIEARKGVAPRNEWIWQQYKASGTDTYHKPAEIHAKWEAMKPSDRAAICPDSPNKVTRATIEQAIKLRKKREATRPTKPKRTTRKYS